MCGILGKTSSRGAAIDAKWLELSCDALADRGPDGAVQWLCESSGGVYGGLEYRRLKVAALAPRGDQYFVRIRAKNACGLGPPSNELRVVVPEFAAGSALAVAAASA